MYERDSKIILEWGDIDGIFSVLDDKIYKYDRIVAVARGGLVPATMISHQYNIPLSTITWQTRDGDVKEIDEFLKNTDEQLLFVDDINDSGKTLHELREYYEFDSFVVVQNKNTSFKDCFSYIEDNSKWIVFPWEKKE